MGTPFEKKYVELTEAARQKVTSTYHAWQLVDWKDHYHDILEFCKSVNIDDLKDWSLVPSKYIDFENHDEKFDYSAQLTKLQTELSAILAEEEKSLKEIKALFDELGFKLN